MANIEMEGLEEYRARLLDLGADIEGICKYAVYDAAAMVVEAIKANTPVDSGDLKQGASLAKFKNEDGYVYTGVYFPGIDHDYGINAIKARVLESGSSTRRKHPFIRPAVNRVKAAAERSIEERLDQKIEQIMGKD